MEVLEDASFPPHTLNTALHLAASLILVSGESRRDRDKWAGLGVGVVRAVCGRGSREEGDEEEEEVKVVLKFFQELTKNHDIFVEVCNQCGVLMECCVLISVMS